MIEEAKVSKSWGGARKGAGRKSKSESEKRQTVTFTLTKEAREKIRSAAEAAGISSSELLSRWAETL